MSPEKPESDAESKFDSVEQIIAQYFVALEAGKALSIPELLKRYPRFADELSAFFADMDIVDELAKRTPDKPGETVVAATPGGSSESPDSLEQPFGEQSYLPGHTIQYFGDYEILEQVARGGMGVVYKARQNSLNRIVALKMILSGRLASEEEVQRFQTEAEAAASLDHSGIVPVYEVGEHQGRHYFSMALVEGQGLDQRIAKQPLPVKEAADIVGQVAEAVHYAHEQGIIHRDLKPANILITNERVARVTDFGLATKTEGGGNLTLTGQILGTPAYMAPEQIQGDPFKTGRSSDVYSLGAILYCSITGRPPFQAATVLETMSQVLDHAPVPVQTLNPSVPLDLATICQKCLEKIPEDRYASAGDLEKDLRRFLSGEPIHARPIGRIESARRWVARNRSFAAVSAFVVLLACIAFVSYSIANYRKAQIGKLEISSHGPALKGRLFAVDSNEPVGESFTIPTSAPIEVHRGEYRLLVSSPHRIGQSSFLSIEKQKTEKIHVELNDNTEWPKVELKFQDSSRAAWSPVPFAKSTDLVIVDPRVGVSRQNAKGEKIWHWDPASKSDEKTGLQRKQQWQYWADRINGGWSTRTSAAMSVGDLNGDGQNDVLIRGGHKASQFVLSGSDGAMLWSYPMNDGTDGVLYLSKSSPGFVSDPILIDVDGDQVNDLVSVVFNSSHTRIFQDSKVEVNATSKIVALSGKTGSTIWRKEVDPKVPRDSVAATNKDSHLSAAGDLLNGLTLVETNQGAIAIAVGNRAVLAIDLETGEWVGNPIMHEASRASRYCLGDCDNDGNEDIVISIPHPGSKSRLMGYSILPNSKNDDSQSGNIVFDLTRDSYQPRGRASDEWLDAPPIHSLDLNQDGKQEFLILSQSEIGINFELVTANGQNSMWACTHSEPNRNVANTTVRPLQICEGPDIDQDGYAEIFVVNNSVHRFPNKYSSRLPSSSQSLLHVWSLSGKTGATLWQHEFLVAEEQLDRIDDIQWWNVGSDGHPLMGICYQTAGNSQPEMAGAMMLSASNGYQQFAIEGASQLRLFDMDHDGDDDLIWETVDGYSLGKFVYLSKTDSQVVWQASGRRAQSQRAISDINSDGVSDLMINAGFNAWTISGKTGRKLWNSFEESHRLFWSGDSFDADDDNVEDVMTFDKSKGRTSALSGRTGSVIWQTESGTQVSSLISCQAFAETNTSIVLFNSNHEQEFSAMSLNNHNGGVRWLTRLPGPSDSSTYKVEYTDLNQDNVVDVVVAFSTDDQRSQCIGSLIAIDGLNGRVIWEHSWTQDSEFQGKVELRTVDLNHDGQVEIVWLRSGKQPLTTELGVFGIDGTELWSRRVNRSSILFDLHLLSNDDSTTSIGLFRTRGELALFDPKGVESVSSVDQVTNDTRKILIVDIDFDGIDDGFLMQSDPKVGTYHLEYVDMATAKTIWKREFVGSRARFIQKPESQTNETMVVPFLTENAVHGINVVTGKSDWRCEKLCHGAADIGRFFLDDGSNNFGPMIVKQPNGGPPGLIFTVFTENAAATTMYRKATSGL